MARKVGERRLKKNWILYGFGGAILVGLVIAGVSFWQHKSKGTAAPTYEVYTADTQSPLLLNGVVTATSTKEYTYSPENGEITTTYVTNGQQVSEGDALYQYTNETYGDEATDLKRQITRLYTQKANAEESLQTLQNKRWAYIVEMRKTLGNPNAKVDTSSFDPNIEAAQNSVQEIKNNIEDLEVKAQRLADKKNKTVVAEVSGVVSINQEAIHSATSPYVTVTSNETGIETTVTEYDFHGVSDDQEVSIYINAEDRTIEGTIKKVSTVPISSAVMSGGNKGMLSGSTTGSSNSVSRFQVQVTPKEEIPVGFNVQVSVPQSAIVLPEKAILLDGQQEYVFLYKNGVAKRQNIKRTKKGFQTVVSEGVSIGDQYVMNPGDEIKDGDTLQVSIVSESPKGKTKQ